jgi:hypothetical protein
MAFTSAGFSCAMHLSRRLYEDPASDGIACGTSVAMAGTTGLLRVLSDRHYLSDVLVGAALGFVVGYLVPLAIVPDRRSHRSEDASDGGPTWAVAPMLSPSWGEGGGSASTSGGAVGLSAFGAF